MQLATIRASGGKAWLAGVEAPDLRGGAGIVRFTSRANTASVRTAVVVSSGSAHHDWAPLVTAPPLSASASGELHSVLLLDAAVILRNLTMRRFAWKAAQVHVSGPLVARALVHLNDDGAAEEWPPVSLENVLATTALSADPLADRNTDIRLVTLLSGLDETGLHTVPAVTYHVPTGKAAAIALNVSIPYRSGPAFPVVNVTCVSVKCTTSDMVLQAATDTFATFYGHVIPEAVEAWRPLLVTLLHEPGARLQAPTFDGVPAVWRATDNVQAFVLYGFGTLSCVHKPAAPGSSLAATSLAVVDAAAQRGTISLSALPQSGWFNLTCAVNFKDDGAPALWSHAVSREVIVDKGSAGLPAPTVSVFHVASLAGTGTNQFGLGAPDSGFTGDHTPRIECSVDGGAWTLCGGATWVGGAHYDVPAAGLGAGLHNIAVRQVLGSNEPVMLVSNVTTVSWYTPASNDPVLPNVIEAPAGPVHEPALDAVVRVEMPETPPSPPMSYRLVCFGITAAMCDEAASPFGLKLYPATPGQFSASFVVERRLPDGVVAPLALVPSPVVVAVDVLPNPVAVVLTRAPLRLTRLASAEFRVAATTADGLACTSARCTSFVCWTTFAPARVACNQPGVAGAALATYAGVPAGTHSFHVAVNDTGAQPTPVGGEPFVLTHTVSFVWTVDDSLATFVAPGDGDANEVASASVVAGVRDVVVDVSLPFAPATDEVVTASCYTNDTQRGGRVTPSKLVFTHSTATRLQITVSGLDDDDNAPGSSVVFTVSCSMSVSGALGLYGGTAPGSVELAVKNINVIKSVIGDVLVSDINGSLVSAVGGEPPSVSLVTSGSTRVVITASDARPGPHFATGPGMVQVFIGGLPAVNVTVSADGRTLEFVTPRFTDACDVSGTCVGNAAYKPLQIVQSGSAFPGEVIATQSLSCPPSCPGQVQPKGVFYTKQCVGYATGATCLRAATAHLCAFGSGDQCQRCPSGGFCPGGARVWSQPGWYTPSEASPSMSECPAPATKRCIGWDGQAGHTLCGEGYMQGASECSACASSYYEDGGECVPCPSDGVVDGVVLPMLLLGVCAAGVFGSMVVVAFCFMRRSSELDKPLVAAARHSAEFTVWTAVTMQTLVQVGEASTGLPEYLARTYNVLTIFELKPPFVPLSCYRGSNPFLFAQAQFVAATCVAALFVVTGMHCCKRRRVRSRRGQRLLATARRGMITAMVVMYPVITNAVLSMLHCTSVEVDSGDGSGVSRSWVVAAQPEVQCLDDDHIVSAALAALCAVVYVVMFPAMSAAHLFRATMGKAATSGGGGGVSWGEAAKVGTPTQERQVVWGAFIDGSYKRTRFWFKQLNMGVLFVLGASLTFLARPLPAGCVAVNVTALLTQLFLYLRLRPHAKAFTWELPVKSLSIVTALSGSVLNYVSAVATVSVRAADGTGGQGDNEDIPGAVVAMSAVTFSLAIALLAVLLVSFVRALVSGSYREDLDNAGRHRAPGIVTTHRMSVALRTAKQRRGDKPGKRALRHHGGGGSRPSVIVATTNPMASNPLFQRSAFPASPVATRGNASSDRAGASAHTPNPVGSVTALGDDNVGAHEAGGAEYSERRVEHHDAVQAAGNDGPSPQQHATAAHGRPRVGAHGPDALAKYKARTRGRRGGRRGGGTRAGRHV